MPFIEAAGLTVHYDLGGPADAPVVLCANSLGTNFHMWDPQAAALSARYRVLRYDMRGHGLTDCPPGPYAIDQLAGDALALMDALAIKRAHLCGLSVGGMVAQFCAAWAPHRVASLMLCATGNRIGEPAMWDSRIAEVARGGMAALVETTLGRWFTPAFRAAQPATWRGFATMLRRCPPEGYAGVCGALRQADLRADDDLIRCPTLVVTGDGDGATPPAMGRALRDAIAGADLVIIEGAAHISTIERPHAVTDALAAFLARVEASQGG